VSLPDDTSPRLADIDWRWALPRIALLFIATRLLVLAVALAVEVTESAQPAGASIDERPIITSLTGWDSTYFLGIAESGYHADPSYGPDYAFYPLYPVVIKVASLPTLGDTAVAAILAANGAFALALVALYALSVRYLTPARALLSLWFLALAPGAAAFTLAYADSLFLFLTVGVFLAAELRRPWIAGIALALATITRAPGLLLILPVLVLYIQRDGWRPTRSWIPLLLAPLALAGFFAYTWWLTGDPIAPVSAYEYWRSPEAPGLVSAGDVIAGNAPTQVDATLSVAPQGVVLLWIGTLAFYIFLYVFFRHSPIRGAYWLVAILAMAGIFLSGQTQSAPRYLAVAWPFDWALASRRSRVGQRIVLTGFATAQVVFLWLHFTWRVPP
jgi:hypothetical protein